MKLKHYLKINALQIVLGLAITGLWIYFTGGARYLDSLKMIRPGYMILLFGIILFCVFTRFLRWQFILRLIGIRIPTRRSLSIFFASIAGIATPAYFGEIIRGVFIKREFRVPFLVILWVFVVERLLDLCVLGIIGMLTTTAWEIKKNLAFTVAVLFPTGLLLAIILRWMGVRRGIKINLNGSALWQCVAISLIAWIPATLLLSAAAAGFDTSIKYVNGMGIVSTTIVLGAFSLIPASIGSSGSIAIQQIEYLNIPYTQSAFVVSIVFLMSIGIILFLGTVFLLIELMTRRNKAKSVNVSHFDEIAPEYKDQFKSHVWNYLLDKRIALIDSVLNNSSSKKGIGLDLGCGLGTQCIAMSQLGYSAIGIDFSRNLAQQAHNKGVKVVNGDALTLPFKESSFDYIFTIGALHHLQGVADQETSYREIARVLKPGGYLIVQETNTRNPLFRFYMGYIFPIISSIDEGNEWWIEPRRWEKMEGMTLNFLKYFTFIPDFIPNGLMQPCLSFERMLESSRMRYYSVHYMAVLQKN